MRSRWTVGRKLMVSFVAMATIVLVLGIVGFYGVSKGGQSIGQLANERLPGVDSLLTIKEAATAIKVVQRTLLTEMDAETRRRQAENLAKARERYGNAMKVYEGIPKVGEEEALWKKFATALQNWRTQNDEFFALCEAFEKREILNPAKLRGNIEQFLGAHYKLLEQVLTMLHTKTVIDGGDDATKCAFGRWKATFTTQNPALQKALADITEPHNKFHAGIGKVKQLVKDGKANEAFALYTAEVAPLVNKLAEQFDCINKECAEAESLYAKVVEQAVTKCRVAELEVGDALDKLVHLNKQRTDDEGKRIQTQAGVLKVVSVAVMVAGVLIAVALGMTITRGINKVLTRVASGLADGAEQVNEAAAQVSTASQQLAEGASEQASSLEETSSALEEMASMARQNAENSKQANEFMVQAQGIIAEADTAMKEASNAMNQISEASDKISKIIKVIEEIAFQTNLLALNAAVEAARAGEHGKGFAVVADEVRNLAQRAAQAARETGDLIEQTVARVQRGVELNQTTSASFTKIGESAAKVGQLVAQISQASAEQAQGVDQVNTAVAQMDKVTQQNAANAEESSSAAQELSAQAQTVKAMVEELVALVGGRRTAGDGGSRTAHGTSSESQGHGRRANLPDAPQSFGETKTSLGKKDKGKLDPVAAHTKDYEDGLSTF